MPPFRLLRGGTRGWRCGVALAALCCKGRSACSLTSSGAPHDATRTRLRVTLQLRSMRRPYPAVFSMVTSSMTRLEQQLTATAYRGPLCPMAPSASLAAMPRSLRWSRSSWGSCAVGHQWLAQLLADAGPSPQGAVADDDRPRLVADVESLLSQAHHCPSPEVECPCLQQVHRPLKVANCDGGPPRARQRLSLACRAGRNWRRLLALPRRQMALHRVPRSAHGDVQLLDRPHRACIAGERPHAPKGHPAPATGVARLVLALRRRPCPGQGGGGALGSARERAGRVGRGPGCGWRDREALQQSMVPVTGAHPRRAPRTLRPWAPIGPVDDPPWRRGTRVLTLPIGPQTELLVPVRTARLEQLARRGAVPHCRRVDRAPRATRWMARAGSWLGIFCEESRGQEGGYDEVAQAQPRFVPPWGPEPHLAQQSRAPLEAAGRVGFAGSRGEASRRA